ncbi:MAG: hypothetical protein LKM31_07385 [Sphingobium sp.]|jgi:hypothetical protein|nr:hypothetical protein [Sphingobium sp.]
MRMQLSAYVPISCSAEISAPLERGAAGSYSLGYVRRFCNTAYQLALNHGEAPVGARLNYKGREVDAGGSRTVLEPLAAPTSGGMDEIRLIGATIDGARQFSSGLFVTITPTGI